MVEEKKRNVRDDEENKERVQRYRKNKVRAKEIGDRNG